MPSVAVVLGSDSDLDTVRDGLRVLQSFGIDFEVRVLSAHRSPRKLAEYVEEAPGRGVRIFIAAAGGAAHLPGVIAALTGLPVIGVPVETRAAASLDSLLSIVQMPAGVPVASVSIGRAGGVNAAVLAARILAISDEAVRSRLEEYRRKLEASVDEKNANLQRILLGEQA